MVPKSTKAEAIMTSENKNKKELLFLEPFSKDTPVDELVEKLAKNWNNSVLILCMTKGEKLMKFKLVN